MSMPSEQAMQAAIASRDTSYDGRFFYGVITTGVFCHPSCSSRPARPENLRFFSSCEAAIAAGFQPCQRCQPTGNHPQVTRLIKVARYIESHASEQLTLATLANLVGLSASRLQRNFKKAFGISPKAYQEAVRMRSFKRALKTEDSVTEAIFTSGYGSISRVYSKDARNIGMKPQVYRSGGAGEVITYATRTTALGPMLMAATEKGVCFVQFDDDETVLVTKLRKEFPKAQLQTSTAQHSIELDDWVDALNQHISLAAPRPDLPLDLRGTAFQISVWRFLLSVREGDVLSYSELATQIDKPKAVRAVASACGANRIGVLIPCHRVLRADGGLGGYRWGLERKRALLDAERAQKPTD